MGNISPSQITDCNQLPAASADCNTIKLLYSMWMTGCLMMMVYVMYNMCRFALNCRHRDKLTIIVQTLSLASLIGKNPLTLIIEYYS